MSTGWSIYAPRAARLNLLFIGLTMVFVGYFQVWLPGPGAGLQLIGIELGEWIKFLGVGPRRDLFYLPPIAIGLLLALLAATWPNERLQTWVARLLAVAVALLAFPALAAIQLEPAREWLARLLLIGSVIATTISGALLARRLAGSSWLWLLMAVVALLGALLPTWQYLSVRPVAEGLMRRSLAVGPGVWLNATGFLLVALVCLAHWASSLQTKRQSPVGRLSLDDQESI
jgi:hypothetical protein